MGLAHSHLLAQRYPEIRKIIHAEFPGAHIVQKYVYLSEDERNYMARKTGRILKPEVRMRMIKRETQVVGYAFVDTHRVRSRQETLLILINSDTTVKRIDVLQFKEPTEYRPPMRWLKKMYGKSRQSKFRPGVDLAAISGATMTGNSVSRSVRMAVHVAAILNSRIGK